MKRGLPTCATAEPQLVLPDLDFLARRDEFLVGQAIRLSPPAVAGVWLQLRCSVGQTPWSAADALVGLFEPAQEAGQGAGCRPGGLPHQNRVGGNP